MNPTLKNILAVIVGWLGGSILNMAIVQAGMAVFPIEGLPPGDMEALAAVMPTLTTEHFIFPFLAHALGALLGAFIAAKMAANRQMTLGLIVGGIFFIGGIMASQMLPAPTWFTVFDLVLAYFPMAWIGVRMASKN